VGKVARRRKRRQTNNEKFGEFKLEQRNTQEQEFISMYEGVHVNYFKDTRWVNTAWIKVPNKYSTNSERCVEVSCQNDQANRKYSLLHPV